MQPDYEKAAAYDLDSSSDTKLNRKALNAINKHKNMAMEKTTEDDNLNKQKLIEFAFTCYNLASTYILSRISVVHHAALNCVRRVFAIVMTSIYFMIPVTFVGGTGIVVSMGGEFADGAGSFTKPLFTEVISLIVFSCSTCYSTFFCFQGSCPSLTTK